MIMRLPCFVLLAALAAGMTACVNRSEQPRPAQPVGWAPPSPPPTYAAPSAPVPVYRPVNVAALHGLQGQVKCAPKEVAPDTWVTFDCGGHRPVSRAVAFVPRMSLVTGPLPPVVDHRFDASEGPIKNQGAVGACTAFSLSSAMDHGFRRMGRQDVIAPLHVWSKYAIPVMGVAGDETVDKTLTLEPSWPYD